MFSYSIFFQIRIHAKSILMNKIATSFRKTELDCWHHSPPSQAFSTLFSGRGILLNILLILWLPVSEQKPKSSPWCARSLMAWATIISLITPTSDLVHSAPSSPHWPAPCSIKKLPPQGPQACRLSAQNGLPQTHASRHGVSSQIHPTRITPSNISLPPPTHTLHIPFLFLFFLLRNYL